MSSKEQEFLKKYADKVCRLKDITSLEDKERCLKSLTQGLNRIYNVVCFDIDGTICERGSLDPSDEIVDVVMRLVEKRIVTVFITGRGRSSSREILSNLKAKIKADKKDISDGYFNRWYCITHNGAYLLSSKEGKFLDDEELIAGEEKLEIANELRERVYDYKSKIIQIFDDEKLDIQFEPTSVRLVTRKEVDQVKISKGLIKVFGKSNNYQVLKGHYGKGNVFELSTTTKNDAIRKAEDYLGIPRISMIRIGDQGKYGGNDYVMLKQQNGFSVGEYSNSSMGCFPVLDEDFKPLIGPKATSRILNLVRTSTALSLKNVNHQTFPGKLIEIEKYSTLRSTALLRKYSVLLSSWLDIDNPLFNINPYSFLLELFDGKSGAVKFRDWEWGLVDDSSIVKRIYGKRVDDGYSRKYLYSMNTDTGLVLRGPYNYYLGILPANKDKNWNTDQVTKWIEFLNTLKVELLQEIKSTGAFEYSNLANRKFILAVLDNIRNILLVDLNFRLTRKEVKKLDEFKILSPNDFSNETQVVFNLTIRTSELLYQALFGSAQPFDLNCLLKLVEEVELSTKQLEGDKLLKGSSSSLLKSMREIDFFVENLIAVDLAFNKFSETYSTFNDECINIYSLLSGGIEMSIISKVLGDRMGLEIIPKFIFLPGDYIKRHSEIENEFTNDFKMNPAVNKAHFNIIADDNILTGNTLQIGIDYLVSKSLDPDGVIIVRYPGINRVEHMFLPKHGAPDLDLFFNFIRGLVSPSPYTKLFERGSGKDKYKDATGVFKKSKQRLERYLMKNGINE